MPRGQGVKPISSLFDKYKQTLKAPEGSVKKEFCEVVFDMLAVEVPVKKVSYTPSARVITLTVGGPLKQELLLHKKDILTHLKGRLGEKSAPKDFI